METKETKWYRVSWNQRHDGGVVKHYEYICTRKPYKNEFKYYENGKALIIPPTTAKVEEL